MAANESLAEITRGMKVYLPTGGDRKRPTDIEVAHQELLDTIDTIKQPIEFGLPLKVNQLVESGVDPIKSWFDGYYVPWTSYKNYQVHSSSIYYTTRILDDNM